MAAWLSGNVLSWSS